MQLLLAIKQSLNIIYAVNLSSGNLNVFRSVDFKQFYYTFVQFFCPFSD